MTSYRACGACGADLPDDERAACAHCRRVACWDCGTANDASQAFCRRCGVWLVRQEPAHSNATDTRPSGTGAPESPDRTAVEPPPVDGPWDIRPIRSVPLRLGPARGRRGRWTALTLAVLLASAAVVSAAALEMRRPDGPAAALAAMDADVLAAPTAAAQADMADGAPAAVATAPVPDSPPPATAAAVEEAAPVDAADSIASGTARRPSAPAPVRASTSWVCDDSASVSDARGRRWIVDRVNFRAMGDYERIILRLAEDGPASTTATVFAAPMASSSVRGSGGSTSRSVARRGLGVELSGGLRTGLELRGFRPRGLRNIRDVSLSRSGSTSRLFITLASGGCFRLRVPTWQAGATSPYATGQLIIDVKP